MEIKQVEVYCEDSNYAVMKPPGRNYPGAVIQGDSLASLARMAVKLARAAAENRLSSEDCLDNIQELNQLLVGRVLHYQSVLDKHDVDYPHVRPLTEDDIVEI